MPNNTDQINFTILRDIIKNDDVVVDVGANVGDYTEFLSSLLNDSGKLYSIELHPDTFNSLRSRFSNKNNIVFINGAACNTDGLIFYYKGSDSCTNNIIGHDMNYKNNDKIGSINGFRLDTLLKDEKKVKLIKIDVEGAEIMVLWGLKNIIDNVDYILVECHLDEHWDKIRDLLLNEYKLSCVNTLTNEIITNNSKRAYQCFCKKQ